MVKGKAKGAYWENVVLHHLEAKGWFVCRRAASLFPDLVCIDLQHNVYAIECKCKKIYMTKQEKIKLANLHKNYGMIPMLAYPKFSCYSKKDGNVAIEYVSDPKKSEK